MYKPVWLVASNSRNSGREPQDVVPRDKFLTHADTPGPNCVMSWDMINTYINLPLGHKQNTFVTGQKNHQNGSNMLAPSLHKTTQYILVSFILEQIYLCIHMP
jgi:hypothetical protein